LPADVVSDSHLVTRENWFDLRRSARTAPVGVVLSPTLSSAAGEQPLGDVSLVELRAVHHVFGSWWTDLGSDSRPGTLPTGAYDRFLAESRGLLRRRAESVLGADDTGGPPSDARVSFPDLGHPLLSNDVEATTFLKHFLWIPHSPSLLDWARRLAAGDAEGTAARSHAWMRLVLQKAVVEDELPEALACLRVAYGGSDVERQAMLGAETEMLAGCGVPELGGWARSLGLDRPPRTEVAVPAPGRNTTHPSGSPDITVLVPSYGHEEYIEATLESVLAQTYPNYRILVVDDRSTDDTVACARRVTDARVCVDVNATNLGLADSVLAALDRVDTPYVALLNSDDVFHPLRLERCREVLERSPSAQVVATGVVTIDAEGRTLTVDTVRRLFDGRQIADWVQWEADACGVQPDADFLAELLERNFLITSSNVVARTSFLRSCAEALAGLKYCLDWQIFLEAAARDALVLLPEPLLGYRLHGSNTVWFDEVRAVAFTLEVNRVLASALRRRWDSGAHTQDDPEIANVLALTRHAVGHSDASGLLLYADELVGGRHLEEARSRSAEVHGLIRSMSPRFRRDDGRPGHSSHDILATAARALEDVAREEASVASAVGGELDELRRERAARDEVEAGLRERLVGLEASLGERLAGLEASMARAASLEVELEEVRRHESEQDEVEAQLRERIAGLEVSIARAASLEIALEEMRQRETEQEEVEVQLREQVADLEASTNRIDAEVRELTEIRDRLTGERNALQDSLERRVGDFLLNRLRLRRLVLSGGAVARTWAQRLVIGKLALERMLRPGRRRLMTTVCWNFPIHSQTFVYQELTHLMQHGFSVRLVYSKIEPRDQLPARYAHLWPLRRSLYLNRPVHVRDYEHYRRKIGDRVEALIDRLCAASGLSREQLVEHGNFLEAFTFTRMVEAYRPDYLHSYFFYDRSLMALVAAYLLELPRGVSCYADHVLDDYELKVVPLHMELCDVVIATSARIKRELMEMAPHVDPEKILVKPNGIDPTRFPVVERREPERGEVFRLVSVCRIEPKKGLLDLVEAVHLLRERGVPVQAHFVGTADEWSTASVQYARRVNERISELDLWGTVHLEGRQDLEGVLRFHHMAHLFVAPFVETDTGDKDGIPTALLEGMAGGLPAVATDAGSITEVVEDGREGLIVPQRQPAALADAIEALLADPDRRAQMGRNAADTVRERFAAEDLERLFHDRVDTLLRR
jgi:glycosyltransferase involved in cell wall biosynthesis